MFITITDAATKVTPLTTAEIIKLALVCVHKCNSAIPIEMLLGLTSEEIDRLSEYIYFLTSLTTDKKEN